MRRCLTVRPFKLIMQIVQIFSWMLIWQRIRNVIARKYAQLSFGSLASGRKCWIENLLLAQPNHNFISLIFHFENMQRTISKCAKVERLKLRLIFRRRINSMARCVYGRGDTHTQKEGEKIWKARSEKNVRDESFADSANKWHESVFLRHRHFFAGMPLK